jgi:hypothetical protein
VIVLVSPGGLVGLWERGRDLIRGPPPVTPAEATN